jgi:hypothetical protein
MWVWIFLEIFISCKCNWKEGECQVEVTLRLRSVSQSALRTENGANSIENTASRVVYRPLRNNCSLFNGVIACLLCRNLATGNLFWLSCHKTLDGLSLGCMCVLNTPQKFLFFSLKWFFSYNHTIGPFPWRSTFIPRLLNFTLNKCIYSWINTTI